MPIASNWSQDMMPLVSVRSTWSTVMPVSSPATALPVTRCASISFRARLCPTAIQWHEGAPARPDVVAAGPDQPVVLVLLDDVRRPARDPARRDDRRKQVDRDPERVEERRRVEVDVRDERLRLVDAGVEVHRHLVPLELARLPARVLRHALEDRRPRIARLVHAVAHAHEPPPLAERLR